MRYIAMVIFVLFLLSCQKSIDPFGNQSESYDLNAYQFPGCAGPGLFFRSGISTNDCFSYSFEDTLKVELCVTANCCPDTHRFTYNSNIENNIISFTVVDTAADLCRCICDYRIDAYFAGLRNDEYLFNCIYGDSLLYSETVSKQ